MARYTSVKAFAKRVEDEQPPVDIVIENARKATMMYEMAEQDESTVTVNVTSTFLLAALLLPKLRRVSDESSIRPTLTIVTYEVHVWGSFRESQAPDWKIFDKLNDEGSWKRSPERYWDSKLLEVLVIQAIAERYDRGIASPVTINFVNPGLCHS